MAAAIAVVVLAGVWTLRPEAPRPTAKPTPLAASFRTVTGPYAATYDFVTPSLGWAVLLDYRQQPPAQFYVFKTSDGTGHWQKQFAGQAQSDVAYLHFFDARHGFLYAGPPYRTVDGGDHWEKVDVPGAYPLVSFASPTAGWAEVFDAESVPHFYRTSDGGKSWKQVGAAPPSSVVLPPGVDAGQGSMFRENGEGWLGAIHAPAPTVFVTADGGATWQPIEVDPPYETDYYDSMIRLMPGAVVAFISGSGGRLIGPVMSRDGGSSWSDVTFPVDFFSPDEVTFLDADHWWLFDSGSVYWTDDGGNSWLYLHAAAFPGDRWRSDSVQAIDQSHAWWALTSTANSEIGALAMTFDGGESWTMVNAPQP